MFDPSNLENFPDNHKENHENNRILEKFDENDTLLSRQRSAFVPEVIESIKFLIIMPSYAIFAFS